MWVNEKEKGRREGDGCYAFRLSESEEGDKEMERKSVLQCVEKEE